MNKLIKTVVLAVLFSLGCFLCSIEVGAAGKNTVKIGGIYPLTGYLSWLGQYYLNGAKLKIDMINKAGGANGCPLDLVVYDDRSSPEEGVKEAQRLITKDGVVAITGTATGPITAAVSSLANRNRIVLVATSGYELDVKKEPYTFNTAHPVYYAMARPFMYFKREGITRIGLLLPIGYLAELGMANAQKAAGQYGLEIVGVEKFDVKAVDVTTQLANLRAAKPQAVYAFATGEPAALVAKNMAQLKFETPLLVSHGNANPGFLKLTAGLPVKIIVPTGKIMAIDSIDKHDPARPALEEFSKAYIETYKEPPNYYSALLADAVSLIAEGIRLTGSTDPQKIQKGIEGIRNFPGLGGNYNLTSMDHCGTRIEDMILLTIKDGNWHLVQ